MKSFLYNYLVILLLACSFSMTFISSAEAKKIRIRIAGQYAKDHLATQALYKFKKKIEAGSDKRIRVSIYPANQLGDYTQVYEELRRGTLDMAQITVPSQFDTRLEIACLNYLAINYNEARKIYGRDSILYSIMSQLHSDLGIHLLGFHAEGFAGLGMVKKPDNMRDPVKPKNILVRVPSMAVFKNTINDEGFQTVSIPFAELYTALQTGVTDGWSGTPPMTTYLQFREVCKYYMVNNSFFEADSYLMSKKSWEKLSEADKKLVADTVVELSEKSFDIAEQNDLNYLKKLEGAGVQIIRLSDEELSAWANHARKTTWPGLQQRLTKELLDKLSNHY